MIRSNCTKWQSQFFPSRHEDMRHLRHSVRRSLIPKYLWSRLLKTQPPSYSARLHHRTLTSLLWHVFWLCQLLSTNCSTKIHAIGGPLCLPFGVTLVPMWIWVYFPRQSHAALAAQPGQSSVPQSSACDLSAEFCPQILISWVTVITQIVSSSGLCRGFEELLSLTIFTACEFKQEWLYLPKDKIGIVLGFICGSLFVLIESTLHVHSSLCSQMAFTTQAVAPCTGSAVQLYKLPKWSSHECCSPSVINVRSRNIMDTFYPAQLLLGSPQIIVWCVKLLCRLSSSHLTGTERWLTNGKFLSCLRKNVSNTSFSDLGTPRM